VKENSTIFKGKFDGLMKAYLLNMWASYFAPRHPRYCLRYVYTPEILLEYCIVTGSCWHRTWYRSIFCRAEQSKYPNR